jgi:hypothetical protein
MYLRLAVALCSVFFTTAALAQSAAPTIVSPQNEETIHDSSAVITFYMWQASRLSPLRKGQK